MSNDSLKSLPTSSIVCAGRSISSSALGSASTARNIAESICSLTTTGSKPLLSALLAHFVTLPKNARVLDLGSGCGTLGLMLCAK
ncbi:MAG: hypothetical protein IJ976_00625, partial [Alistipes sp.]|nr:hypothetical protein [Alistipes sp.]